jgi:hypothetical protein
MCIMSGEKPPTRNPLVAFQRGFEARFERFRDVYHDLLRMALTHRKVFVVCFLGSSDCRSCWFRFSAATSSRRSIPARSDPYPLADRHPRRGNRQPARGRSEIHPADYPARQDRHHGRQYRHADLGHQPDL